MAFILASTGVVCGVQTEAVVMDEGWRGQDEAEAA